MTLAQSLDLQYWKDTAKSQCGKSTGSRAPRIQTWTWDPKLTRPKPTCPPLPPPLNRDLTPFNSEEYNGFEGRLKVNNYFEVIRTVSNIADNSVIAMTSHSPQGTAGPPITLFCSTSFHSNADEKKNFWFLERISVWFAYSPHVCVGVLPDSKKYVCQVNWRVYIVLIWVCVCVWVHHVMEGCSV